MKINLFFRQIRQQKVAWILNVLCLSVAFAVLFIAAKQVKYDFSFDTTYPGADHICELCVYNVPAGKTGAHISMPVIREALTPIPEVEAFTILSTNLYNKTSFFCGETEYTDINYYNVRPGFTEVFRPRILSGDAEETLKNRDGLLIPQSLAEKWFEKENAVGKSVGFGNKNNLWSIKAVYEDFPENSSMRNAVLFRLDENKDRSEWSYLGFCRLHEGADIKQVEKKIVQTYDSLHLKDMSEGHLFSEHHIFKLLPIEEIYFSSVDSGLGRWGNKALTLCLMVIGILIIAVAYINFINFSTALAPSRIGTLNLCKITGASAGTLRRMIIGEAVVLSFIAWCIAFLWVWGFSVTSLAKAYFSASLNPFENIGFFLSLGGIALVLGGIAGIYPAYYMTSFSPALVLKGSFALSGSGRRLRNGLLMFQFVVTIVLIIASLFVVIQHHYLLDLPWGYSRENIVYAPSTKAIEQAPTTFRSELMKNPDVLDVTASRFVPGRVPMGWGRSFLDTIHIQFYAWPVASNFLSFFGIRCYEGDSLREPPEGKDYAILNRRMVEKFHMEESLGEVAFGAFSNPVTVLGFAENVNFASLRQEIEPMAFICGDDMWNEYVFVKIRPERVHQTVDYLKECFARYGDENCSVTFLDDFVNSLYRQEENLSRLIFLFCAITIVISLAGIYGLILFNIRYKVKEVGVRKINGATEMQILWMLNRIFIRLMLIGFVIAVPIAVMLVNGWLDTYPYRTPVHWWVFVVALLLTLIITLATVSWQSWKAANANPVDAVKTE